jgi:hypothetical protein
VADRIDDLAGLTDAERARLEQFAEAFERVDASSYPTFTEVVVSDETRGAQERAVALVGSGRRRDAVRAAVGAFVDEGTRAYSRRMTLTDTFLLFQSLPDRAEDRVRFLATVERAVVALILWDELDVDDRAALLGPWGAVVQGES